jgi:hypothetical protein
MAPDCVISSNARRTNGSCAASIPYSLKILRRVAGAARATSSKLIAGSVRSRNRCPIPKGSIKNCVDAQSHTFNKSICESALSQEKNIREKYEACKKRGQCVTDMVVMGPQENEKADG